MSISQMRVISFKKGAVIFRQGDREKSLYKILAGAVGIYSDYGGDHEMCLSLLQKDQCFGGMSILEDCPRSATAIAEEDVSLASYPEHLMVSFVYQNPAFALELMQNLSRRLRNSTVELETMHQMLFQLTQRKVVAQKTQEYIRLHTVYDTDGTPKFNLVV